jgi:calcium-translocating P-type ATPase
MTIQELTVTDALASVHSTAEGLSPQEAARRLGEFGPNELPRIRRDSITRQFLKQFTHFFALVLWVAASLAFAAEFREPGKGMALLGYAIVGVIVINGSFSFWQAFTAERAILALQQLLPDRAKVMRGGAVQESLRSKLVPGDIILLETGDDVPADGRLIESIALRVNDSAITGESIPRSRDAEPCAAARLMSSRNVVLAGSSIVAGNGKALVFATGQHTEFGRIAHLTQTAGEQLTPLQREIIRLSRVIAALALGIGLVFFLVGSAIGLPFWANFIFAIGIIVANVPEGLLPTVTLALAMGSQRMAKRKALIRNLPAVETLGSTTVICTDKTGTLTENQMSARWLYLGDKLYDATNGSQLSELRLRFPRFFDVARFCHDLKEVTTGDIQNLIGDPMEIALRQLAGGDGTAAPVRLTELPFDSDRRRLSTIHAAAGGPLLLCKGAPEVLLERCSSLQIFAGVAPLTSPRREVLRKAEERMAREGYRVIALAMRELPLAYDPSRAEEEMTLLGFVGLEDPPRAEVPDALRRCISAGIRVIMVTGDHPHTAAAIARQIGLTKKKESRVLTGDELLRMSDTQLQFALDHEVIFARVGADQKMRIVSALKRKGEIVAVTGDGVNDAPALKTADIGIAMGATGTDVARESSDMILLDDNFASIVAAIEEGRAVYANIRKFLTYILTSNVPEIIPYIAFVLFRIPLPLTVIQILAVDLGTDMVPALGLGAEPPDPTVMQVPPRPRSERLLSWPLLRRSYFFLGVMEAAAAMSAFFVVLHGAGWHWNTQLAPNDPNYFRATTACLSAIVVMQVANVFICRSETRSVFRPGVLRNKLILAGIAIELLLILLIDYTRAGNLIFATAPLPLATWLFIIPLALAMLLIEEARKLIGVIRTAGEAIGC